MEALRDGVEPARIGKKVICPSTERGSRRAMAVNFLNCMAMVKRFGPPAPSPTDPQRVMPGAQYYDAIHNKNNKVTLWLVEPTGAIHHEAVADLRRRARCATSAPSARDGTKYGAGRHATRSYLTHHTQRIALAASRYEACHIIHVINQGRAARISSAVIPSSPQLRYSLEDIRPFFTSLCDGVAERLACPGNSWDNATFAWRCRSSLSAEVASSSRESSCHSSSEASDVQS